MDSATKGCWLNVRQLLLRQSTQSKGRLLIAHLVLCPSLIANHMMSLYAADCAKLLLLVLVAAAPAKCRAPAVSSSRFSCVALTAACS
jgi:hypothetical protein